MARGSSGKGHEVIGPVAWILDDPSSAVRISTRRAGKNQLWPVCDGSCGAIDKPIIAISNLEGSALERALEPVNSLPLGTLGADHEPVQIDRQRTVRR